MVGKRLQLPCDIETKLRDHLHFLHNKSSRRVIDSTVISVAWSIITKYAPHLKNKVTFSKCWAEGFRHKIGIVIPRGPYKKQLTNNAPLKCSTDVEQVKFRRKLRRMVNQHNIHPALIFNIDQIKLSLTTGMKQSDHSNHITLVLGVSMLGVLLPLQIIFAGLDETCFPKFELPNEWIPSYSKYSNANSETMEMYVENILRSFIKNTKYSLQDPKGHKSLLILDKHGAHTTNGLKKELQKANVYKVEIPGGLTHILQPIDNEKYVTDYFRSKIQKKYNEYYHDLTVDVLTDNSFEKRLPNLQIDEVKELTMKWICKAFKDLAKETLKLKSIWDHIVRECHKK